ncbi:MAG: hypothetical protein CM15mV78_370 [uncultured marine virus]|nr:MAG: hypothetical protein CM15mV78_370 [uncultured marine virus]
MKQVLNSYKDSDAQTVWKFFKTSLTTADISTEKEEKVKLFQNL